MGKIGFFAEFHVGMFILLYFTSKRWSLVNGSSSLVVRCALPHPNGG